MSKYARKKDSNQDAIVSALLLCGCNVTDMSAAGNGFTDLFVTRAGVHYILECKSSTGKLTTPQALFHVKHQPVHTVRTPEEALKAVGL
jgi:Holliday junction resolvase